MRGAALDLDAVTIKFGDFTAVDSVDVSVRAGEFICLLGPSGCGKSTLISAIAGFEKPANGRIHLEGQEIRGASLDVGMVFQSSEALFDWLTIRQNIEYGPKMRGVAKKERQALADEFLSLVGLAHCADQLPRQLSGGMRQRAQIARVLANEPRVVLMDEPFGALDAQTRQVMQQELDRIWRTSGCTVIFVTHDIDEAIVLADRILVMTAGPEATIKSSYDVDIPRPRDEAGDEAIALHRKLREDIGAEVRKALQGQGLTQEGS
ncbi:ABC transporter ATP-binding protein [Flexivirga endophytica]|uniref:ABC transporter ATP-binding protein n=1 Tax=Flexivirga endophytica TaxID=1849103 RepID=A0A916WN76_9MICO|nr:ABC transporter ATP-binding protein [Flexivirga endophytica]GHB37192.1 ABC transporter ATP-binding protein [Flexivirga endophytica]